MSKKPTSQSDQEPTAAPAPSRRDRQHARAVRIAGDPSTDRRRLWLLSRLWPGDITVGRAIVGNPNAGRAAVRRAVLTSLGKGRWQVAVAAINGTSMPERLYERLAASPIVAVRAALAASPRTPPDVLRRLKYSGNSVRLHLATNPSLTSDDVELLLKDRDSFVRCVAAAHPSATPAALQAVCADLRQPAWMLRAAAANRACPADLSDQILTWLALGGAGDGDPRFKPLSCSGNPGPSTMTPAAWYLEAARRDDAATHALWRVRAAVALPRPRVLIADLLMLAGDPQPEVRRTAARYPGLPAHTLEALARDDDALVAQIATASIKQKRIEWRRQRPARLRRRIPRFAPLFSAVVLISFFSAIGGSHSQVGTLSDTPGSTAPADIASILADPSDPAGAAQIASILSTEGGVVTTRALPGGGEIQSGPMAEQSGMDFVNISAGRSALTTVIGGLLVSGASVTNAPDPLVIPQDGEATVILIDATNPTTLTIYDSDGGTTTVLLSFEAG